MTALDLTRVTAAGDPPDSHLDWARRVARRVARAYRLRPRSQEEWELEQAAALAVVRAAGRFDPAFCPPGGDPDGLFRGWCRRDVVQECRREAVRLRNGGSYRTRREGDHDRCVIGRPASDLARLSPTGEFDLPADYRADAVCGADPDAPGELYDLTDDLPPAGSRSATYHRRGAS
jgi:hypothetical protein